MKFPSGFITRDEISYAKIVLFELPHFVLHFPLARIADPLVNFESKFRKVKTASIFRRFVKCEKATSSVLEKGQISNIQNILPFKKSK